MFFKKKKIRAETQDKQGLNQLLNLLGITPSDLDTTGLNSLKQSTVYACIRILSDTVSKLPVKVYKKEKGIRKEADHIISPLLNLRPNHYMSASDFWKCVEIQRNIYGNSFVYIQMDNTGQITGLYPLENSNVQIYVDDKGILDSNNNIWYIYTDNVGKQYKFTQAQILHFKSLTTNGLVGISPIDQLKHLMENGKSAEQYINSFFKNGLQVKGLIQYVGDLNKQAEDTFRNQFERMSSGLKNAHRVALLPLGYQFQNISQKLVDAQFLENTQLNIRQIASVFGIKMHQLNDLERATHTNIAEQQKEFYIDTLQSILSMYEQELMYKLFLTREIRKGMYLKFNVNAILRADIKTRYISYQMAIQNGFLTPNEVRALEEKEPKEGGDKLLVNGNMLPIEMAGIQYKGGENNEN